MNNFLSFVHLIIQLPPVIFILGSHSVWLCRIYKKEARIISTIELTDLLEEEYKVEYRSSNDRNSLRRGNIYDPRYVVLCGWFHMVFCRCYSHWPDIRKRWDRYSNQMTVSDSRSWLRRSLSKPTGKKPESPSITMT